MRERVSRFRKRVILQNSEEQKGKRVTGSPAHLCGVALQVEAPDLREHRQPRGARGVGAPKRVAGRVGGLQWGGGFAGVSGRKRLCVELGWCKIQHR